MILARHHGGWVIVLSFVAAMALTILPLPGSAELFRPEWTALVLVYWCLALPERVGVGIAWLAGLLTDVLKGGLMGEHALGLTVVAFLTLKLHQRIRVYPMWQQALSVLVLLALYQLVLLWINGIIGHPARTWLYWAPSVTGTMLWPAVFLVLRGLRRRFRVA
ncbi:MAG: rod shape-determining protein MreD [Chromatiales bacterium 21-64-14]|nr:MAG: rod shape-determining protein MreD [Chromatiales bacterium 21-64-14]HQU15239.1 rod shape-determining protein MreD [Gammaproteobacteria bacterium]